MKLLRKHMGNFTLRGGKLVRSGYREEQEPQRLTCMAQMKKVVRTVVKESGATKEEVIRSFGLTRQYGK